MPTDTFCVDSSPFQVLPKLKDRKFLARQSQWYFLSSGRKDRILGERTLPAILQSSHPQVFKMEMAPRAQHQGDGVLRLRVDLSIKILALPEVLALRQFLLAILASDPC